MNVTDINSRTERASLRSIITKIAEQKGLLRHVNTLSNVMAVRFLQEKEGYERCFKRQPPYKPTPHSHDFCGESNCTWEQFCNTVTNFRGELSETQSLKSLSMRDAIDIIAEQRNLSHQISNLSDVNAIRFMQANEGYEPCFGNPDTCNHGRRYFEHGHSESCLWQNYCNAYRSSVTPLDKAFPSLSRPEILRIKEILDAQIDMGKLALHNDAIGLKIASFDRAPSITKKIVLSSPKSIFLENADKANMPRPYLIDLMMGAGPYPGYERRGGYGHFSTFRILFSSDLVGLRNWLRESQPFIENGNISYSPISRDFDMVEGVSVQKPHMGGLIENLPIGKFIQNYSSPISTPYLGFQDGEVELSQPDVAPILNIELPILEDIDLRTLYKLMTDYPEELSSFRDFLHTQIDKMRSAALESESFYSDCRGIEREIRDRIRKVESDYKKTHLKAAFSLTGSVIASFTLAMYCILCGTGNILTVLGPGGVAYQLSTAYSEYLRSRLEMKENPVYFLWLVGKSKNR